MPFEYTEGQIVGFLRYCDGEISGIMRIKRFFREGDRLLYEGDIAYFWKTNGKLTPKKFPRGRGLRIGSEHLVPLEKLNGEFDFSSIDRLFD
ncbi:hypothetical protein GF386_05750 [Candidatus Pacearchaeota archaeon]|nr:hypothetical protein [Candidatus Pacearchaeota archaeon]MBD3283598.1 hypothetical protein [Candidatus Pacearchaeota archaeon]